MIEAKKCGKLADLVLSEDLPETLVTLPSLSDNLNEEGRLAATSLLTEYANFFSTGSQGFGTMKDTKNKKVLENKTLICTQPYQK